VDDKEEKQREREEAVPVRRERRPALTLRGGGRWRRR
jgi:hypothetical protein